jgi:hypothetical protein
MRRPGDKSRHGEKTARGFSLRLSVSLSLCLLAVLTGCSQDNRRPPTDPLTGGSAAASSGATLGSPAAPPVPMASAVPPVPVTGGGTASNAALASGASPKPLPGGTDLRIAGPNTPGTWQGQTGATLQTPQPATPPAQPVSSVRGVAPAGPRVTSYEQAMALLTAKGVKWRRLETIGEPSQSQFSCSIPNPRNAFISRTYEARAATDLEAIQAVIDQINKDSAGGLQ